MNELERINEIITTNEIIDFCIKGCDGVNLVLKGSFDFFYYHDLEVEFKKVSYVSISTDFSLPFFRIANREETNLIRNLIFLESKDIVYCIEAETSCSLEKIPFFIVAESIKVTKEKVFYYKSDKSEK